MRAALRAATEITHLRLHEHPLFADLAAERIDRNGYTRLLQALYGFHRPLEDLMTDVPRTWWFGLDREPRMRAHLLIDDLGSLGCVGEMRAIPLTLLEHIKSPGDLFGRMYVREGATLGGRVLSQKLDTLLGAGHEGRRFLAGTPHDGKLWRRFCETLEVAAASVHPDDIIDGACATFDALELWMDAAHARASAGSQ